MVIALPVATSVTTCAVIMAAYRATRWIHEALESVDHQEQRDGWSYSLRIGVDGCEETSESLLRAGRAHWFSRENVGPYVIRNSLIEMAPASAYAVFDADDVMRPEYLRTLLGTVGDGVAGAARRQVDAVRVPLRDQSSPFQGGVCVIAHDAWAKLGGYRAWRIAADHDLVVRAKVLKVPVRSLASALYDRRVHDDSLTRHPETGFGSQARKERKIMARQLVKGGAGLHVTPETVALELREP
jgi:glycosyltransferase involved in cell wall biosynthesis